MCFDISLLFRNKPLFVQLSTNKFGRLLTAHQHTAKDRPHAETTTHPIGSHTRNEQSRIDFLRIFYGCRLTQLDIQRTFADHAPSRSIQLDIVFASHHACDFTVVAGSFQDSLGHDCQRVHMHTFADNRSPVYHHSGYSIVMEHYIFYGIAVENSRTGFRRTIDQSRGRVYGIHRFRHPYNLHPTHARSA